jgi:DNA sulfur modification protein DndC
MISLNQAIPVRFCPSKETLQVLNERQWICSYSGGKDSTSLVTWIEWLRRIGMVKVETPRLVMSDTTIEYPFLRAIAGRLMAELRQSGWTCDIVTPPVHQKLYCMIFGRGLTPVHPGGRKMRWCTRATKIDPMTHFARTINEDTIQLSGVRWGESNVRDGKLETRGCSAGGECGLPDEGEGVYGPIITWRTCKVIEWLSGEAGVDVNSAISNLLPLMNQLVQVYEVKIDSVGLYPGVAPKVSTMRFGCIGCPAITNEKITKSKQGKEHPQWLHLRRIHEEIWPALYMRKNRCAKIRKTDGSRYGKKFKAGYVGYGPIRMEVRKHYFAELLKIQADSGVELVTAEDIAFIHQCWRDKVYPRGWSEADELTVGHQGLFEGENQ